MPTHVSNDFFLITCSKDFFLITCLHNFRRIFFNILPTQFSKDFFFNLIKLCVHKFQRISFLKTYQACTNFEVYFMNLLTQFSGDFFLNLFATQVSNDFFLITCLHMFRRIFFLNILPIQFLKDCFFNLRKLCLQKFQRISFWIHIKHVQVSKFYSWIW